MRTKLDWLNGQRFHSFVRRENDWVLTLENSTTLSIECLWRLILNDKIKVTSADDEQYFGLTESCIAAESVTTLLTGTSVSSVSLKEGTLDLGIFFNTGAILEILPTSSGYEAWSVYGQEKAFVALGGGELIEENS